MQEMPTFAVFMNLRPRDFAHHSYTLHVFLVPNEKAAEFVPPATYEEYETHEGYAGTGEVFGGKGDECVNCIDRKPFHVAVDVTDTLRALNCERHDVTAVVIKERDDNKPLAAEEEEFFSEPLFKGPFFASGARDLQKQQVASKDGEVLALQARLAEFGFYKGSQEGWFGDQTEAAVKRYQEAYKLASDGVAGPLTKGKLTAPLFDGGSHIEEEFEKVFDVPADGRVTFWAGKQPGYLDDDQYQSEIELAFSKWATHTGLDFVEVGAQQDAAVRLIFSNDENFSDGDGGKLAAAHQFGIKFDASEQWLLQGEERTSAAQFEFLPVLLHEIGHIVGVGHSFNEDDVMYPYYTGNTLLSNNDKRRAGASTGLSTPSTPSTPAGDAALADESTAESNKPAAKVKADQGKQRKKKSKLCTLL